MNGHICLPTDYLLIIFCIFIGLTVWYIHNDKKKYNNDKEYKYNDNILNNIINTVTILSEKINENNNLKNNMDNNIKNNMDSNLKNNMDSNIKNNIDKMDNIDDIDSNFIKKRTYLNYRDKNVLYDDFAPPERRVVEYQYPTNVIKQKLNIPTRGEPENYQLLGILLRNNTESVFNLFGRQTFPGSNQYEYFVEGMARHGAKYKIAINIHGNKEILDDMIIHVPGTDQTKGSFKVKLHKFDVPRYNPFIY